jgi:hypothetical protein
MIDGYERRGCGSGKAKTEEARTGEVDMAESVIEAEVMTQSWSGIVMPSINDSEETELICKITLHFSGQVSCLERYFSSVSYPPPQFQNVYLWIGENTSSLLINRHRIWP